MHSVSPCYGRNTISRFASAIGLTFLLMIVAALARAQCTITGPDVLCGGTAQLCGSTEGIYQYSWSGPNGFALVTNDPCVDVSVPGTYSLIITDYDTGFQYGPCTHVLAAGSNTVCSITGPVSACTGTAIDLCGPTGNVSYSWTGPNGYVNTNACIHVSVAGAYQLAMTDLTTGCAIAPCEQTIAFTTCETQINCPRTARFWGSQCASAESLHALTAEQVAGIAACVDQHCDVFAWSSPADGFCSTLNHSSHMTLRQRAKRQMAALGANVCAGALAVETSSGSYIGLDPSTVMQTTTIGTWMADADQQLVTLESANLRDKSTKVAYRTIIRTAWNINHGRGIGPVCGRTTFAAIHGQNGGTIPVGVGGAVGGQEPDANASAEDAAEPLDVELADDAAELVINRISPNPASSRATISYDLVATSSQQITLGVYDLAGRRLRDFVIGAQAPGSYTIEWDGRDNSGQSVPGGVYFVRGHAGSQPVQSRLTLVR